MTLSTFELITLNKQPVTRRRVNQIYTITSVPKETGTD